MSSIINTFSRNNLQTLNSERLQSETKNDRNLKAFQSLQSLNTQHQYFNIFSEFIIYLLNINKHNQYSQPLITENIIENINKIENYALELFEIQDINNSVYKKIYLNLKTEITFLFINLLMQNVQQSINTTEKSIHNSSIITFLILKSYYINSLSLKSINEIKKLCSQLLYNFRLVTLYFVYLKAIEISKESKEVNISDYLNNFHKLYLNNTSQNCFEEITQIRLLADKYAADELNESKIIEISDDIIKYENTEISIPELKSFNHKQIEIASKILYNELICINKNELLNSFNIFNLKDIIQEKQVNFNFINISSHTQNLIEQSNLLITLLLTKDSILNKKLVKSDNKIIFNLIELQSFFKKRREFLNHFYLICHMTSGSPLGLGHVAELQVPEWAVSDAHSWAHGGADRQRLPVDTLDTWRPVLVHRLLQMQQHVQSSGSLHNEQQHGNLVGSNI